ncbi:hypothetical protein HPB49_004521 [Dermacentor silvarum]|uniref:Uncharacterized protein n=1 Tax=Dermacentor silvarum TaxID=543639 RepID=A0ACB8DUR3_DERSI|nr:hypothetical protein HPB49_004521 [Dermacentor silvarum]
MEARTILADAGMEIHKRASNHSVLQEHFQKDRLSFEDEGGDPYTMKVLELRWERSDDSIVSADQIINFVSTIPIQNEQCFKALQGCTTLLAFLHHSPFVPS